MPTDHGEHLEHLRSDDVTAGPVMMGSAVALLVCLFILGPSWGWTIAAFAAGALLMAGCWRTERRR